jgi:aldehyde dehydrogenase (NAD+)
MRKYDHVFIGGRFVKAASTEQIEVRSPHDRAIVGTAPSGTAADVDRAVAAAAEAFQSGPWPRMRPEERRAVLSRFNELYATRASELAELVTSENGIPRWFNGWIQAALSQQTQAYLDAAELFDWERRVSHRQGGRGMVRHEPAGVVAAVIPWNSPQQSATVKLVPALLAGCTVILKPAPETPLDAFLLAEVLMEAGLPEGVLSVVPADRGVSEHLISHPAVDKVAFTGSTAAGKRIASIAGGQLKRVSLELGGKSACVILDDADIEGVVEGLKFGSLAGNGENCAAQTRVLCPLGQYDEISQLVAEMVASLPVGDPSNENTFIGPMVRQDQQDRVRGYIRLGADEGATILEGGPEVPDGLEGGFYVRPTVFGDVKNAMRIAQEEIFGPVLALIPYHDTEDAIRIANDSPYGLGGGVWTSDVEVGLEVARRMRTGTVMVNGEHISFEGSFGGFKNSGIGREFGVAGLREYVEEKSISF